MVINPFTKNNSGFIINYNAKSSLCSIRKISHQEIFNKNNKLNRLRPMYNADNEKSFDVKYKILLLGDTRVGKSSLQRFVSGQEFRPYIGSTIGMDFISKIIPVGNAKVNLQIWDTAGQKNFRTIGKAYYASTKAFVLVYDVTSEETFNLIQYFNQLIEQTGLDMERRYLVANKIDLIENRRVDEETGQRYALRNNMVYLETSCKTGENVNELFERIASDLAHQLDPKIFQFNHSARDNFAFRYNATSSNPQQNDTANSEPVIKANKKNILSSLSYEPIDKNDRFNFRSFLRCCKPR